MATASTKIPRLAVKRHTTHVNLTLNGLPAAYTDVDPSRLALVFYCLGTMDLLGTLETAKNESRRGFIWEQYASGSYGSGFRPGPFMTMQERQANPSQYSAFDTPHIITTYAALLSLAILRDDFTKLDPQGVVAFLRSCQRPDGSFSVVPNSNEHDLRTLYCAFAISDMLGDWSGIDSKRAVDFITRCRTYEGGYGQSPLCEAQGGTTYLAIASLTMAHAKDSSVQILTESQREKTIHWLIGNQAASGGFAGRTNKEADACYCFWCGASLRILGAGDLVDARGMANFLGSCQSSVMGGIAKAPLYPKPDPYHTYLSLAALAIYPPPRLPVDEEEDYESWKLKPLDPLLNASFETVEWIRAKVTAGHIGA